MYNKTIIIIRFSFVISNNQGQVKSYQLKPTASRFVWLAVGEAKQRPSLQVNVNCRDIPYFFRLMYNKTIIIIRFGFGDLDLDYSGYHTNLIQ